MAEAAVEDNLDPVPNFVPSPEVRASIQIQLIGHTQEWSILCTFAIGWGKVLLHILRHRYCTDGMKSMSNFGSSLTVI